MTAIERVRRTQRALEVVIGSSVLFWTCATLFGVLTVGAILSGLVALPPLVGGMIPVVAVLAAVVVFAMTGWRGRFAWSFGRVALWIEERAPQLRYALVTAIDPRYQGETSRLMEPVVAKVDTGAFVRTAAKRSTLPSAVALVVAVGAYLAIPSTWKAKIHAPAIFSGGSGPAVIGNRLIPLTAVVTPPAYAHQRTETLNEPSMIVSLIGSRVVLSGLGSPDGIQATLVEIPPEETSNKLVGDSAHDDSEEYEEAQAAARQRQSGSGFGGGMGMGGGGLSGLGMPGGFGDQSSGGRDMGDQSGMGGNDAAQGGGRHRASSSTTKGGSKAGASKAPSQGKAAPAKPAPKPLPQRVTITKPLTVTAGGKGWTTSFVLSDSNPALLKLVDRQYHRDVIINPRVDQAPVGRLLLPARDTTMRKIEGTLSLSAVFNDDIGLTKATFTYIKCHSPTGNPEEVKCVPGVFTSKPFNDAKSGEFAYSVPFSTLGLAEGDLLSVRAVVVDNNTVTGPDTGVTESRTIRIATKSEYEKLNVNPAPPSADTALVTLRMLLMAVKQLDHTKGQLEHKVYEDSSIKLGGLGQQVRNKIDQIIDEQTGGGEVPINPLLAIARDSMFPGVTDLYIADTHTAIPPIQVVYDSLKKFTDVAKYYLRGIIPPLPVNISRVRLTGEDSGAATPRMPRPMSDVERDRYMREYTFGVQQLRSEPDNGIETLTLLQVETLRKYPALATALGDAISAVRSKKDPGAALLRARRVLGGSVGTLDTLPVWSGTW